MNYQNNMVSDQYEQILQIFSNYLNDTVNVINTVKKSIYQILNIHLHSTQVFVHPNLPSVSVNCKKTLDDLKRISSILRGYSKSKNQQRQQQQTRRSRVDSSSFSRGQKSKNSRISYNSNNTSNSASISRFKKPQSITCKQEIDNIKFEIPSQRLNKIQFQNQQSAVRLKNHRSLRNLKKGIYQSPETQDIQQNQKQFTQNINYTFNSPQPVKVQNNMSRKRSKTLQDQPTTKQIALLLNGTQNKFKQCLIKHECGINQIIQRNSECLQMLKDIHNNIIKKKKQKKQKKQRKILSKNSQQKIVQRKYQAMTPSFPKKGN